jgi:short-subunit dehydrogenase
MIGSKEKYALVTGASSGIGYELAKLFAQDGKNIVVVARSRDKLEDLKNELENKHRTKVKVLAKDLSKPEAPQEIFPELEKEHIEVDVLVNNAGFSNHGMFPQTNLQQELEMIQVNIISLIHLTKLFLKTMVENKSGWILNVGSIYSFVPVPWAAVYGGTKSFVLSFSEALASELKGTGVSVTCLCPGFTYTGFQEKATGKAPTLRQQRLFMGAAKVARTGYKALGKGRGMVLPGPINSFSYSLLIRFLPRSLVARVSMLPMKSA